MKRDQILNKLDINPNDWVLEIGSGPNPFIRSDIIADKFINDNTQRAGNIVIDRPTIVCDAHYLPFVDNSFDYIFCSQLLEHLDDPDLFCKEIARVGKKGYIETPNEIREHLFGWPFHKWIVSRDENGLVLRKNDIDQPFGLFFHELQLSNYEFSKFFSSSFDLLNVCYEWYGKPEIRFIKQSEKKTTEKKYIHATDISNYSMSGPIDTKLIDQIKIVRKVKRKIPNIFKQLFKYGISPSAFGRRHTNRNCTSYLIEILACPKCKKKMIFNFDKIHCKDCNLVFKKENNIIYMLP